MTFGLGIVVARGAEGGADWLTFAGALIGAGLTVAGSVAVLEWQRTSEIRARRKLLLDLLEDVYSAVIPFQLANDRAMRVECGRDAAEQVKEVQAAIRRVKAFRDTMEPKTAAMMRVSDVLSALEFDDGQARELLRSIAFYPDSADLGGLNAMGHEVQHTVEKARKILRS